VLTESGTAETSVACTAISVTRSTNSYAFRSAATARKRTGITVTQVT
jgi:hypothetical protein